jgi:ferrous iron transport protein A
MKMLFNYTPQIEEGKIPSPVSTLDQVPPSRKGIIVGFLDPFPLKGRLRILGIHEGAEVEVVRRAPFGDPVEISVGTLHLALRKEDLKKIQIIPR